MQLRACLPRFLLLLGGSFLVAPLVHSMDARRDLRFRQEWGLSEA